MPLPKISRPASGDNRRPDGPTPPSGTDGAAGPALEVAHVLFMDVIGYSKLRMHQQAAIVVELQELVQKAAEVQKARAEKKLIIRPTGDGMALLFLRDLLSPVRAALELQILLQKEAQGIKTRTGTQIALRMGIHSGSVLMVEDLNAQSEVAGEGIILAQRVMDCGDSGHILLSSDIAERLIKIDPWSRYLKDLGTCHVKHGVSVHLYNLSGRFEGFPCGNSTVPRKVSDERAAVAEAEARQRASFLERHPGLRSALTATAIVALVGGAGYGLYSKVPAVKQIVTNLTSKPVAKPTPKPGKGKPAGKGSTSAASKAPAKTTPNVAVVRDNSSHDALERVDVPEVIGQPLAEAKRIASDAGLKMRRGGPSALSDYARGYVYQQSPAPGTGMVKGGVIVVRISKGEKADPAEQNAEKIQAAAEKLDESSEGDAGTGQ